MAERVLVLGGTRSGKSAAAEALVTGPVRYVATGARGDAEMAARIDAHRARRPVSWRTVETTDLCHAVRSAPPSACVLVDDLGGWLVARMSAHGLWPDRGASVAPLQPGADAALLTEADGWWAAAGAHPAPRVVVVADESGLGVTPADPGSRRYLDLAGDVVQRLAATADRVLLAVAGRVVELPPPGRSAVGVDDVLLAVAGRVVELSPAGRSAAELPPPGRGAAELKAVSLGAHGDTMVPSGALDLAVNVEPTPPHVRAVLAAADPAAYPDDAAARSALAARHRRAVEEVLPVAGAAEAFWLLARVVAARHAVCVHPSFTAPEAALRAAGVHVTRVLRHPGADWALDGGAVPADADLVVLGNPNNPTGILDPAGRVAALCRPGRIVVVDEAFMDFVPDEAASLAARRDLPGLVVLRSATKLWGVAGVRAGYVLAPPGLVARAAAARQPWPLSSPALAVLELVAGDDGHRRAVAARVAADRAALLEALRAVPGVIVAAQRPEANFVLVRVDDGPRTHAALLERGIAVRPSTFPGLDDSHLRITVRGTAARQRLLGALASSVAPAAAAASSRSPS